MTLAQSILASLAGAALFAFLAYILKQEIIPWIRSAGDNLDLRGEWHCYYVSQAGNKHNLTLKINQHWRDLSGDIEVIKTHKGSGWTETKKYKMTGELRDRIVTWHARNSDPKSIGAFCVLLEVMVDARTMRGLGLWYSMTERRIRWREFEWNRTS